MSGLLDYFANNARNLWGEIQRAPQDLRGLFTPEFAQQVKAQMKQPVNISPEQAANAAMDYMQVTPAGGLLGAIKVFHGSPYKFDKFNMSKIGTGEGAQAYGHGLYFAESPDVAKSYLAMEGGEKGILKNLSVDDISNNYGITRPHAEVLINKWRNSPYYADEGGSATETYWGNLKKLTRQDIKTASDVNYSKYGYKTSQDMQTAINKFINTKDMSDMVPESVRPQMYEVSLRWPDAAREAADPLGPQHFLDWDNGGEVFYRGVVDDAARGMRDRTGQYWDMIKDDPSRLMYRPADVATMHLRQQGLPGIRYLDGMSRSAGEGSANYVIFDDALAEILKRNGKK